jgi:alkyl hydroperoxide reductase subunit AhpF
VHPSALDEEIQHLTDELFKTVDSSNRRRHSLNKSKQALRRVWMAKEKDFAKELNDLITRYIKMGCEPQVIVDELTREANSVFGHYNLEIYLEAKCCKESDR